MIKGPLDSGLYASVGTLVRSIMPEHTVYCEPFFREGEVFFTKHPSRREVLNDTDQHVINFYTVLRTQWQELSFLIESTLYSDTLSQLADDMLDGRKGSDALYRAWALWLRYNRDRVNRGAWLYNTAHWLAARTDDLPDGRRLQRVLSDRLQNVQLTSRPADEIIRICDSPDTFFYFRPTDRKSLNALMPLLGSLQGRFALYYHDRRLLDQTGHRLSLVCETAPDGTEVYTNFKRQKNLFD